MAAHMSVDASVLAAIEKLYAAATDESLWPQVMQDMLSLTDSVGATFCAIDGSAKPTFSAFTALNFEPNFIDEYIKVMMVHDPMVQYIVAHPHQRLVRDSQFITEREKDKHCYYDWHHRFSDTRHRLAGMACVDENITSGVTVHRTRRQGDYHPSHVERFECLLPHLERAVSIGFKLGTLGATQQVSFRLLDANPQAIIVIDEYGRVVFVNSAALEIAADQDGLVLSSNGVSLNNHTEHCRLQNLIGRALGLASGETAEPSGAMQAHRPSGKNPYSILVSPLCRTRFMLTRTRPAVCIVIADPEKRPPPRRDLLRSLYGLTPAEGRLADQLMRGISLQSAAAALGISYKTARTQLAAIFRKTSTCRQNDLVKLLCSDLPAI